MSDPVNLGNILCFENIDLSLIYLYRDKNTVKTKPAGEIKKIKTLHSHIEPSRSFDKYVEIVAVVESNAKKYVRVTLYNCYAGPNGRPCGGWSEYYFLITSDDLNNLTFENWRNHVKQKMDYSYNVGIYGTGEYMMAFDSEYREYL